MATQQDAIELIEQGRNVFLSGGAGRGKSYLIDQIYNERTVLLASTGIAALNIGGATCHSVFGLPIGLASRQDEITIPFKMREIFCVGSGVDRIIIDEIGPLRADSFDLIDKRLKLLRGSNRPFGGLQMVVVGDLYQIEPIVTRREELHFKKKYKTPFCFGSNCWDFESVILTKNYRQENGEQSDILDSIRTQDENFLESLEKLKKLVKPYKKDEGTLLLCCYKDDAQKINDEFYSKLEGKERTFLGEMSGDMGKRDLLVDSILTLKIGAKVLIKSNNAEEGYYNGDRGVITEFTTDIDGEDAVVVITEDGREVEVTKAEWQKFSYTSKGGNLEKEVSGKFKQLPLKLGYAITVHACQGMTLDDVAIHFGKGAFAHGQGYVSLSRIRDLTNLMFVKKQTPKRFQKNFIIRKDVKQFYKEQDQ